MDLRRGTATLSSLSMRLDVGFRFFVAAFYLVGKFPHVVCGSFNHVGFIKCFQMIIQFFSFSFLEMFLLLVLGCFWSCKRS